MNPDNTKNNNADIAQKFDFEDRIKRLETAMAELSGNFYKNNFSDHQDFNKYCNFTTRVKVPHYDTLPTTNEVGELVESGGVLYVSTAVNTWTVVGTQS